MFKWQKKPNFKDRFYPDLKVMGGEEGFLAVDFLCIAHDAIDCYKCNQGFDPVLIEVNYGTENPVWVCLACYEDEPDYCPCEDKSHWGGHLPIVLKDIFAEEIAQHEHMQTTG